MGPRLVERGKLEVATDPGPPKAASMGPRLVERGKERPVFLELESLAASMGPRSVERGKDIGRIGVVCRQRGFNGAALGRARKVPLDKLS